MLSLEKCRAVLGQPRLSDDEIEDIRNKLYGIAEIMVTQFLTKSSEPDGEKSRIAESEGQ